MSQTQRPLSHPLNSNGFHEIDDKKELTNGIQMNNLNPMNFNPMSMNMNHMNQLNLNNNMNNTMNMNMNGINNMSMANGMNLNMNNMGNMTNGNINLNSMGAINNIPGMNNINNMGVNNMNGMNGISGMNSINGMNGINNISMANMANMPNMNSVLGMSMGNMNMNNINMGTPGNAMMNPAIINGNRPFIPPQQHPSSQSHPHPPTPQTQAHPQPITQLPPQQAQNQQQQSQSQQSSHHHQQSSQNQQQGQHPTQSHPQFQQGHQNQQNQQQNQQHPQLNQQPIPGQNQTTNQQIPNQNQNQNIPSHSGYPNLSFSSNDQNPQIQNFRKSLSNSAILKFIEICESLGTKPEAKRDFPEWEALIQDIFSDHGVFRYGNKNGTESRSFEFNVTIIPRFFFSIVQSGVVKIQIVPTALRSQILSNGSVYVESSQMSSTHWYSDGSYVCMTGNVKAIFNQTMKLDWMDLQNQKFTPGVEWASLDKVLETIPTTNNTSGKEFKKFVTSKFQVFKSMSDFGLQESVVRVMQVGDVMAHLKTLMSFCVTTDSKGPLNALEVFNKAQAQAAPPMNAMVNGRQRMQQQQNLSQHQLKNPSVHSNGPSNSNSHGSPSPTSVPKESMISANTPSVNGDTPTSIMAKTPTSIMAKTPSLDISQSTLTKRRKLSNINDSGSNGPSPKSNSPRLPNGKSKKLKR